MIEYKNTSPHKENNMEQSLTPEQELEIVRSEFTVLQRKYNSLLRRLVAAEDSRADLEARAEAQLQEMQQRLDAPVDTPLEEPTE